MTEKQALALLLIETQKAFGCSQRSGKGVMGPPTNPPLLRHCSSSHRALVCVLLGFLRATAMLWGHWGPLCCRDALRSVCGPRNGGSVSHRTAPRVLRCGGSRPSLKGSSAHPGGPDFACEGMSHLCLRDTPRDRPRHRLSPLVGGERVCRGVTPRPCRGDVASGASWQGCQSSWERDIPVTPRAVARVKDASPFVSASIPTLNSV